MIIYIMEMPKLNAGSYTKKKQIIHLFPSSSGRQSSIQCHSKQFEHAMADKPWSSGRILTPSQRDRKRKRDKALKKEKRILFQQRTADMEARLYRLELFTSSHLGLFISPNVHICGLAYTLF